MIIVKDLRVVYKTILIVVFILSAEKVTASRIELQAGFRIPVTHSLGVEYKITNWLSTSFHTNILTSPYKETILNILKAFDTDEILVNTIGEAFSYGMELQPQVKFWYRKIYLSVYYSYFKLVANDSPADVIETFYQFDIPDLLVHSDRMIRVEAKLNNLGLAFGRTFTTKIKNLRIRAEISSSKCYSSLTRLYGKDGLFPLLSEDVDNKLNPYLVKYGYIPSVNIYLTYSFNSRKGNN